MSSKVAGMLRRHGHEAWEVVEARLQSASDDEVSVYADDMGAVLLTHDEELIRRRRKNTFGIHVHLRCEQPDAVDVLGARLREVVDVLQRVDRCVLNVSREGVWLYPQQWD